MINFIKKLFSNNNAEIKSIINDNAFLVDVRTPSEFYNGNVSSSINIPLDTIQNKIDKFKNKKHVVVFCQSGMRRDRKSTRLNSSHVSQSRMPSSA